MTVDRFNLSFVGYMGISFENEAAIACTVCIVDESLYQSTILKGERKVNTELVLVSLCKVFKVTVNGLDFLNVGYRPNFVDSTFRFSVGTVSEYR